jgi:hypothetical protein
MLNSTVVLLCFNIPTLSECAANNMQAKPMKIRKVSASMIDVGVEIN